MRSDIAIEGRLLYASKERLVLARGLTLFESTNGGTSWELLAKVPAQLDERIAVKVPLLCRLLRYGVHHFVVGLTEAIAIVNNETYRVNRVSLRKIDKLHGSRPMNLCAKDDDFYYGEYRSNVERTPVNVWRLRFCDTEWQPAWTFSNVRHVHGVYHDGYTDSLWVTTGDNNSEAAIWHTDDEFRSISMIAGGSQQLRAVQLIFTGDHVYFGSDTPDERNCIYRMDRNGQNIVRLAEVGGSVFYGCKVGSCLFFSTAVEPSRTNYSRNVELWYSRDGDNWTKLDEFKKDFWSMKYFQYGQIFFPKGPGDDRHVYYCPFAVTQRDMTFKIDIEKLCELQTTI